ncbi:MAG: alpha-amylase [Bacteroidetes bacterium]|nr:alpha-amylase [Bacteroidota bacterium]
MDHQLQPTYYFHVRKESRKKFEIEEELFSVRGDVVFLNFQQSRRLAEAINTKRPGATFVNPSELNAMGLIHEILHFVMDTYRKDLAPGSFKGLLEFLDGKHGEDETNKLLKVFLDHFPPPAVFHGKITKEKFLTGKSEGISNRQWIIEEIILIWLNNANPGYQPINELIHDTELKANTSYLTVIDSMKEFFEGQPKFGPKNQNLIDLLYEPILRSPNSLMDQLEFIRQFWGSILARSPFWTRLLVSMDYIKEEGKWYLFKQGGWNVSKDIEVSAPQFSGELYEHEAEAFSPDKDWMPRVVMIAKSAFVWLDQLTKKYGHPHNSLADIPDEELDSLASKGITTLWLIGLWQRSIASARIKQINGNPEAVASAYSLYDYEIAWDLGGYGAYENLRNRCAARGVRLASDMVPNHMGIDSSWVINHPEWFVSLPYPPYPNYRFNGTDLSNDPRIGLYVEDGYWDRSDAAVCFKRVDRWTGDVRYIYHGNDGTSFPWNDTAQLNYLLPEVREQVIQTILHVARMFPVIRFDAAMTLAKRHYQRLWFPLPGTGGDIPSRSEHAMSKEEFDRVFPIEFWREVVDRVAVEVPNTLLLAEAFWMMEGYFVRTLGMHRVYNSAFMHMFKKEDNQNYRYLIKNTLEFNPQILKRYVNFMNNPDEETAVNQFGKGDKYFGVALMMSTLPGLPMFGHGQFEGFAEKYGMEYRKAYKDESPDQWLIDRHYREIVPILKKRYLFAEVENFLLYDFFSTHGNVCEDVFAFSNQFGYEKGLVIFHNKYGSVNGWIRTSTAFLDNHGNMTQRVLGQGLALPIGADDSFTIFKDQMSGLEFIRSTREIWERGMYFELGAYEYHVFWEFRNVTDSPELPYREICTYLAGKGVYSIEDALVEMKLKPIFESYWQAINPGSVAYLAQGAATMEPSSAIVAAFREKSTHIVDGVNYLFGQKALPAGFFESLASLYRKVIDLSHIRIGGANKILAAFVTAQLKRDKEPSLFWQVIISWLYSHELDQLGLKESDGKPAFEAFHLDKVFARSLRESGYGDHDVWKSTLLVKTLSAYSHRLVNKPTLSRFESLAAALTIESARPLMQINMHNDVLWFNKESVEELVMWLEVISLLQEAEKLPVDLITASLVESFEKEVHSTLALVGKSGYRYQVLVQDLDALSSPKKKIKTVTIGGKAKKPAKKETKSTKPSVKKEVKITVKAKTTAAKKTEVKPKAAAPKTKKK